MIKQFFISVFLLLVIGVHAQQHFQVIPVTSLNTKQDDIACGLMWGDLIHMKSGDRDMVNDYSWNSHTLFHLEKAVRGNTFQEWSQSTKLLGSSKSDYGPASFGPCDSLLFFSTADNFGQSKGNNLKIFYQKYTETGWTDPVLVPFCTGSYDYTHPYYDCQRHLLLYSSNAQGGMGKMDVWFVYKLEKGWGEPVNPGMMVNSESNEIFPTVFGNDIVYSTDVKGGLGGYDLKKALGNEQWKTSSTIGEPMNSAGDDIAMIFLSDEKFMITSNRKGGAGGDDIYVFETIPDEKEKHHFTAVLEQNGATSVGTDILVTNRSGEIVLHEKTDSTGHIPIEKLKFNQPYRFQLGGISPLSYSECVLVIYDERGNRIRELHFNVNGFADLELLPLSMNALNLLSLEDQSLLSIQLEGQLYDEQPGDVGKGEPVTILDESGIPVAIAYTNDVGKFRFTKVEPQMEYTFQLSEETSAANMLITDRGERITLPVLNAEVKYQRISPQEAIELTNEFNEKITVSLKDIFVINRIYFDYNSARLTPEAKLQLEQLSIILQRNADIGLELRSHTDSRGNDDYNLQLSQKRAKAALEFLIEKGMSANRCKASGLGETELLNECDDGVNCSDPEHSINRRTEIRFSKLPVAR